jgi:RND family efflux transporter MFP subunit
MSRLPRGACFSLPAGRQPGPGVWPFIASATGFSPPPNTRRCGALEICRAAWKPAKGELRSPDKLKHVPRGRPNSSAGRQPGPLLAVVALTVLSIACSPADTHTKAASNSPAIPVQAATVSTQSWPDTYEATGTVRARSAAALSSKVMAYVRQVSVQVGDPVKEGQELVTLDAQDLDVNVRRAEAAEAEIRDAFIEADNGVAGAKANLDLAQSTFKRMQELAQKKSISNQEFDEASARLKSAQAVYDMSGAKRRQLDSKLAEVEQEIRGARIMCQYARISAPFSGVVTAKSVEPGNLAAPGAPLLTIERQCDYRLEASVDESRLPFVKTGQAVEVALESLDRHLPARVSEIVPAVDSASRAYIVKIDLPALPNLRSGMFGRAIFPMSASKALALPAVAVVERGQLHSVFAIEDGVARNRLITTGKHRGELVEVLSGLSEGEKVVSPIASGVVDGAHVEVRQ